MVEPSSIPYPIAGELADATWEHLAEGQPLLLTHDGKPTAVIVDLESWKRLSWPWTRDRDRPAPFEHSSQVAYR